MHTFSWQCRFKSFKLHLFESMNQSTVEYYYKNILLAISSFVSTKKDLELTYRYKKHHINSFKKKFPPGLRICSLLRSFPLLLFPSLFFYSSLFCSSLFVLLLFTLLLFALLLFALLLFVLSLFHSFALYSFTLSLFTL